MKSEKEFDGMDFTKDAYEKKYEGGYGIQYPEGHVIRFYERVLKAELQLLEGKILDFGCGNGVHSKYLSSKGFVTYGVDVSEKVIKALKSDKEGILKSDNYYLVNPGQDLTNIFSRESFDVVFANQSLYYLDNESLRKCVDQLYQLTVPGGVCFFTMMSEKNTYYSMVKEQYGNGLSRVVLNGRLKEETNINFTTSVAMLEDRFKPFSKIHIGQYEPFSFLDSNDEDGCSHHYMYIGRKI